MLTPQFVLPISSELVVVLFAGGGGASTEAIVAANYSEAQEMRQAA